MFWLFCTGSLPLLTHHRLPHNGEWVSSHEIHIFFSQTPPCISHLLNMNILENSQVRFVGRLLIIGYDASYWNKAQARQLFGYCPTCQTLLFFARVARMDSGVHPSRLPYETYRNTLGDESKIYFTVCTIKEYYKTFTMRQSLSAITQQLDKDDGVKVSFKASVYWYGIAFVKCLIFTISLNLLLQNRVTQNRDIVFS